MAYYHHHHHNRPEGCGCSAQSSCGSAGGSCGGVNSCGSAGGCASDAESGCACRRPCAAPGYTACCRRIGGDTDEGCSCNTRRWHCGGGWHRPGCGGWDRPGCGGWDRPGCGCHDHCWPDWDWDDDDDDDDGGEYEDVYYGYLLNTILSPGEEMSFTEGYNSPGSGIYPNGGGITLSPGTYRVSYSGSARPVEIGRAHV